MPSIETGVGSDGQHVAAVALRVVTVAKDVAVAVQQIPESTGELAANVVGFLAGARELG